ncbi:hypothetical protein CJJ09_004878 [Candidozyma auris]|nr:hypothetical protein CJJ09_004878 [[Candida] auris]
MDDAVQTDGLEAAQSMTPLTNAQNSSGPFASATTAGAPNDLFTNFMDSSFINMNLQATAEEDNYLNDDFGSLLNFQSM